MVKTTSGVCMLAMATLLVNGAAASPIVIDHTSVDHLGTTDNVDGATITPSAGDEFFVRDDFPVGDPFPAFGLTEEPEGEIGIVDVDNGLTSQSVTVTYDEPAMVTDITLAYLYPEGVHGDFSDEIGRIDFDDGFGELTATGATTHSLLWSGPMDTEPTVTNVSSADLDGAGAWELDFGEGLLTSELVFTAVPMAGFEEPGAPNSDFGIHQITAETVTEPAPVTAPGALAMMGVAFLGLAVATGWRRKPRQAA